MINVIFNIIIIIKFKIKKIKFKEKLYKSKKQLIKYFILFFLSFILYFFDIIKNKDYYLNELYFDKWIVLTTINPPTEIIYSIIKIIYDWKIVVIGDVQTNDHDWKLLNHSNKLIYLSIKEQLKLRYETLKYIPTNSYSRKNIGYLYAIQHGAKEIYEIDDNIISNFKYINWTFNKSNYERITLGNNDNSQMINPYSYFGLKDIWPRGFKLNDINKNNNNDKFYNLASTQINFRPLIYQGLINGKPDIDSIFLLTRIEKNKTFDIIFNEQYPLLYLPRNYVPINSKNTKYLYDIFPTLPLPTTINKKISDILRGYIMQCYAWRYNGTVIYISSDSYQKGIYNPNTTNLMEEKNLYFKLEEFFNILNDKDQYKIDGPIELILSIIKNLITKKILGENDLNMYKAFIKDLSKLRFNYSTNYNHNINFNEKDYFSDISKLHINIVSKQKILIENNNNYMKLLKHKSSNIVYNDILLAINYNYDKLINLNNYINNLYSKYFTNIIFISPGKIEYNNTILCPESGNGMFAYICFRKLYDKYPNFKGYIIINDDNFLKPWEIENLNFDLPWINYFDYKRQSATFFSGYKLLENMINNNKTIMDNIFKLMGNTVVPKLWIDSIYMPNSLINKMTDIFEEMHNKKIFLELAVPTAFAIKSIKEFQIINSILIWFERKFMCDFLKKSYNYLCIHPIKLSIENLREALYQYIYFINGNEY